MAIDDEFAGRGIGVVMLAVLGVPFATERRIRRSTADRVQQANGAGGKAARATIGGLMWLAYVPAIILYEAFAVPLVVGSVLLTGALVAIAFAVGWPPVFVFRRARRWSANRPA